MEVENYITSLKGKLNEKANDNSTYRKAVAVLESVIQAAKMIPDFNKNYASNNSNLALYIFGAIYKLLLKVISQENKKYDYNTDSYLLLLNYTISEINTGVLKQANLLNPFQKNVFSLLSIKEKTPLMTRLTLSILSHSFLCEIEEIDFEKDQGKK